MKVKQGKEQEYEKFVEINSHDFYSYGIITYLTNWANLMEEGMARGEKLEDIADITSDKADTDGITGFMFYRAQTALYTFWEYGEELHSFYDAKL